MRQDKSLKATSILKPILAQDIGLAESVRRSKSIIDSVIQNPDCEIGKGNFTRLTSQDLEFLFDQLDQVSFQGQVRRMLNESGFPIKFRVSKRMTNSGGITTTRFNRRHQIQDFEIAISSTLLFESFRDDKPILVTGILCGDRLQALKRIMEHEMIHLIEMLIWKNSNCSALRFRNIAKNIFRHRQSSHQLITPRDRAEQQFDISTGDWVKFKNGNHLLLGFVNRITKRATILVPSQSGVRYNDGKRYDKYYVPLNKLAKAG
ncbi:MAG: hypothetical protein AAGA30_17350 [Planctomycetota bacterium]